MPVFPVILRLFSAGREAFEITGRHAARKRAVSDVGGEPELRKNEKHQLKAFCRFWNCQMGFRGGMGSGPKSEKRTQPF